MSKPSPDTQEILECLRKTAHKTLDHKRRLGQYAVVWENGHVRKLEPEETSTSQAIEEGKPGYNKSDK